MPARQVAQPSTLRILIACETSGVMRNAFAALGHDVWSVDLLPAEDRSNRHIVGDVRDYLHDGWDLLIVCHPPCTRLCLSGVRWLHEPPRNPPADATPAERLIWSTLQRDEKLAMMWRHLDAGAALFAACWNAPIERIAVENPMIHSHARERLPHDLPKPQIVQPWWFGEPFFKATGFYLKGLPLLTPTNRLTPPLRGSAAYKEWSAVHLAPPGPDRWKFRSRTFAGVANACAVQWGEHAHSEYQRAA